ncbi:MAG TPA: hypothetical protein VMH85_03260, partial [Terriglobales bacterium]|nr:hypothetical protein [Terriglobales bacterium]
LTPRPTRDIVTCHVRLRPLGTTKLCGALEENLLCAIAVSSCLFHSPLQESFAFPRWLAQPDSSP